MRFDPIRFCLIWFWLDSDSIRFQLIRFVLTQSRSDLVPIRVRFDPIRIDSIGFDSDLIDFATSAWSHTRLNTENHWRFSFEFTTSLLIGLQTWIFTCFLLPLARQPQRLTRFSKQFYSKKRFSKQFYSKKRVPIWSDSIGFGLTPVRLVRRVLFGVTLPSKSASTSEVDALLAVKLLREARQPLRLTRFLL